MSSATWSLRERPVWSLRPGSPISAISRRSIARWMSSSAISNLNRPRAISVSMRSRPPTIARISLARNSPTFASICACAIEPRISWRKSRRSKGKDAVNASTSGIRPRANLPRMRLCAALTLFFWRRPFTFSRCAGQAGPQWAVEKSIEGPQLAGASARRTTHRTVGMGNMNIHLVMAVIAISRARRTGHELGLRSRRLELDDLAQLDQPFLLARASARSLRPASLINPSASAWL